MQFQVPQFIETEDKIVGPLTLRQFIYVGIGGVLCFMLYFLVQTWLFVIGTILIMGVSVGIAFLKVNGMPLLKVGVSAFNYYWKPQTYIWKPNTQSTQMKQEKPTPQKEVGIPLEKIMAGAALHKTWETLQTGSPPPEQKQARKQSDREFIEKKMAERYQIFQKLNGARDAARRVDYR